MQFGKHQNAALHQDIIYAEARKGYHESGLVLNNLLDMGIMGIGVSAFYRHGAYAYPAFKDNLSVMIGLTIMNN